MNLKEFRSNPSLVEYASKLFSNSKFQLLLEALRVEHPKNYRAQHGHVGDNAHHKLGRIEGYDEYETNMLMAAVAETPMAEQLQASFQPPETEQDK